MKNYGMLWTEKDMWKLCELYHKGWAWEDMAKVLGRSVSGCKTRLYMIKSVFRLFDYAAKNKISYGEIMRTLTYEGVRV